MDFVTDYWQQLAVIVLVIMAFARMEVNIEILKEKVKTLFDLWNNRKK